MAGLRFSRDAHCHECGRLGQRLFPVRVFPADGSPPRTRMLCVGCLEALAGAPLPSFRQATVALTALLVLALTL